MKPEIDTVIVLNEVGQQVPMKLLKPMFTAEQLKTAKVAVLLEVGREYGESEKYPGPCFRMANELGASLNAGETT